MIWLQVKAILSWDFKPVSACMIWLQVIYEIVILKPIQPNLFSMHDLAAGDMCIELWFLKPVQHAWLGCCWYPYEIVILKPVQRACFRCRWYINCDFEACSAHMIWPHVIYNYMDDPFSMHYLAAGDIYMKLWFWYLHVSMHDFAAVKMVLFSRHELATGYIYEKSWSKIVSHASLQIIIICNCDCKARSARTTWLQVIFILNGTFWTCSVCMIWLQVILMRFCFKTRSFFFFCLHVSNLFSIHRWCLHKYW